MRGRTVTADPRTVVAPPEAHLARLAAERAALALGRWRDEDAWTLGSWLWSAAEERRLAVVVDIRRGDRQLFHAARPGTWADHDAWAARKIRTVQRFDAPSRLVALRLERAGQSLAHYGLDPADYALAGGAVPVDLAGCGQVAVLAVSGLTQDEDHALAVEALRHLRDDGR